ncbi:apolipoprotein N-acyltransferase [Variovorax sp. PCZ-1]|uniref:apolipoprotein N-acyltransferase n=1 Tax=Variovorax sp. PCZ-1 TaxID=2835533 RepID=UPI001BCE2E3B|nr:apolipoprotein N-acyltransferase [Variovorax sp. PCZ-1]MBS7808100.1 apolipoprotein N-acyltransferase [Variovorax sp. PCZ-1]
MSFLTSAIGRINAYLGFLSLLAGYAQAISIAAPWNGQPLWWLQMLSLAALVMLIERASSARHAAFLGWLFATSWLCGTVWWLFISMHVYGGLAAPLAVLAIFALCGFLGLYYAAASYFYKRFRQIAGIYPAWSAIVFASAWMLAELARDSWFTGFPWGAGGYAHVDGPLRWLATDVGVYGTGWFSIAIASWMVLSIISRTRQRWKSWLGVVLISAAVVGFGYLGQMATFIDYYFPDGRANIYAEQIPRADIALLQGNIPQGEKFDPTTGVKASLDWYREQLLGINLPFVITPETAIPLLPRQLPEDYWEAIQKRYGSGYRAALIGIPLGDFEKGYTNSVLGLKPNQAQPYQYDKHHLVPFGEFIPPLFKWFTQMMNIPLGDFNRGAVGQASFEWAGQRWAPNICYEDLFGDELARRFVDEKTAPTVMVNVSNIGWFGNTVAIDQHLQISRMRALELGRPMVRATNTGATVIINHRGEVTQSLPRHTRGVLTGTVEGRQGLTPFAWWAGRFGLWPLWILGITILLIAFRAVSTPSNDTKSFKNQ